MVQWQEERTVEAIRKRYEGIAGQSAADVRTLLEVIAGLRASRPATFDPGGAVSGDEAQRESGQSTARDGGWSGATRNWA